MTRSASRAAITALLVLVSIGALVFFALLWAGSDGGPARAKRPPGFRDLARESGLGFKMEFLPNEQGEKFKINLYDHGCGVVVGDYNGDGHDDLFFLNQLGPNALYRNRGDGTFEDVTQEAGVALADRICVGGTFADYDNDGDQDLYITSTRGGNVLFQNQGDGRFQDVTKEAGLTLVAHSQTAAFFDADNDGYLDLLVTNSAGWTTETQDESRLYYLGLDGLDELFVATKEFNTFYRNQRDGTFRDETEAAGLRGQGWGGDVAVFDYDDDGDLDVFITNMFGRSQLYANDGSGRFRDVTADTLRRTSWG
ncbi:MAG: VCBS repeat-containing protein, partial [Pirellulales bacterium]